MHVNDQHGIKQMKHRYIYTAQCREMAVLPGTVVCIPTDKGYFTHPETSPDGRKIIFWGICRGTWDVWLADLNTFKTENITSGTGTSCHPTWSPDGKKIAYSYSPAPADAFDAYASPWNKHDSSKYRDVWMLDLETGTSKQLTSFGSDTERPAWSPDGRSIACVVSEGSAKNIYTYDLATGNTRKITRLEKECYRPAWHPSGEKLAFNTKGPGSHHIWTTDACGESFQQITRDTGDSRIIHDHGAWWSAGGENILFHSDRGGSWGLWIVEVKSGELSTLPVPGIDSPSHASMDAVEQLICFDSPQ